MEPLKEMFNAAFYRRYADAFASADKKFNPEQFYQEAIQDLEQLSLNERMRHTSVLLKNHLPDDFKKAVKILYEVIPMVGRGYTSLVFPDYVSLYGLENHQLSMEALKYFTSFGSSEFAIRVFLKKDFKSTIPFLYQWAEDENHHVRRLASEGSRPRLPWSFKLEEVIKDPSVTSPILEKLKADPELYVRKSVANHLNDVSKDNPDFMLKLISGWDASHPSTAWIIRHASRSLIKKGHAGSLAVFAFERRVKLRVEKLSIHPAKLQLGETMQFQFDITSEKSSPQKLVVDYRIHYLKKSGLHTIKVFKLKQLTLQAYQTIRLEKKQLIKDFSTRKHFSGKHWLEIQVNGIVYAKKPFDLLT